jgi:glycine oxidase
VPSDPPIVICGAGVIGCATAYELSARGARVVVVEAERVAFGASGTAAGLLSPPGPDHLRSSLGPLLRLSFERHLNLARSLPAESNIDYGFARYPQLHIARTDAEERALREEITQRHDAGLDARWLDPTAIHELLPWLDATPDLRGALRGEDAAQIEPDRFTEALLAAACVNGAELRSGRVQRLVRDGDRVTGVVVDGGTIPASTVVIAMGPWSRDAGAWLGSPVRVEPLKGQIVRLRPDREFTPGGFVDANDDYAVVKASGLVYLGTTEERAGFDLSTTDDARDRILRFGRRHSAVLARSEVVAQTACLRPLSPDALPIIGPAPGLGGVILATGHGRKGLLLAPATGLAVAEQILDGRSNSIDLDPFDPDRFR